MATHDAAQDILALLKNYQIIKIDIDFCKFFYMRKVGPQLLESAGDLYSLIDTISPLTPALGIHISLKARPNAQWTIVLPSLKVAAVIGSWAFCAVTS